MIKNIKEIERVKRQTHDPYVLDFKLCNYCTQQATLFCPTCQINYCESCAPMRKGLPRCRECGYRLHPIPRRFIGSVRPLKKMYGDTKGMKRHDVAPKLYPKADRTLLKNRRIEEARKTGSFCIHCGSNQVRNYSKSEWQCKKCKRRFRKR